MGRSGALGSDQLVDPLAQVLQDEVLVGRSLAVVDFLRPLLKRELYAEGLIDGERDVEEIETIDLKIVDGMTFRLDILARDIASLRNDFGHFIECGGHRACSLWSIEEKRRPSPARASPVASGPSFVNAPYSEGCWQVQRRRPPLQARSATAKSRILLV